MPSHCLDSPPGFALRLSGLARTAGAGDTGSEARLGAALREGVVSLELDDDVEGDIWKRPTRGKLFSSRHGTGNGYESEDGKRSNDGAMSPGAENDCGRKRCRRRGGGGGGGVAVGTKLNGCRRASEYEQTDGEETRGRGGTVGGRGAA